MTAAARRKKPGLPRRKWTRNPVQKPHSTPKGDKGYDRARERERTSREIDENSPAKHRPSRKD